MDSDSRSGTVERGAIRNARCVFIEHRTSSAFEAAVIRLRAATTQSIHYKMLPGLRRDEFAWRTALGRGYVTRSGRDEAARVALGYDPIDLLSQSAGTRTAMITPGATPSGSADR